MNREELEGARKLFFTLLWVDIVATAIIGLNAFSTVGTLRDINAGRTVVDQSMLSSFDFWDNLAKLTILTLIGVGIGLVKWLNACYSYAKNTLGVSGLKNEGYTTWGWMIPVFNLFKPYQVIAEIYKVGAPTYTGPEDWKRESGSGALLAWWIFWAVTHLIMWMMFRMTMLSAFGNSPTMRGAIMATEVQAWTCVVSLVVAGLWFWVANLLTQRLLARSAVSANAPPPQYAYQVPTSAPRSIQPALTPVAMSAPPVSTTVTMSTNLASAQQINVQSPSPFDEDAVYEVVANEMESGKMDKGLWTRLFAELDGDEKQIKIAYIKQRAEKLMVTERTRFQEQAQFRAEEAERKERLRIEGMSLREKLSSGNITPDMAEKIRNLSATSDSLTFMSNVRLNKIEQVGEYLEGNPLYVAITNSEGMSPLHVSVSERYLAMSRLLIQKGAPVDVKNMGGQTPLVIAQKGGNQELIALLSAIG
jgi:hypothetical protein